MGSIPLRIGFDKIDGLINIYDGIRYLVILNLSWFDEICDSIKYPISKKSDITDSINHNFARIRIYNLYNSLPIENVLTFHNVMILLKSVVDENKNNYSYNIFIENVRIKINPIHNIFKWKFIL